MATRSQANRIAAAAALLVFLILALVVDRAGDSPESRTHTTVEREAAAAPPVRRVTSITFSGGRRTGSTRTTEVQTAPARPGSSTVTTTETVPLSTLERVVGNDVLTYLIALIAAFLTAAALQRILLGRYGGSRPAEAEGELAELTRDMKLELARIYALIAELEKGALQSNGAAGGEQGQRSSEAQRQVERLAREAFALEGRSGG